MRGDPPPSVRELQVVAQLARGKRYREAADALGISRNTVQSHIARLCGHFGVHTLTGLVFALGWTRIPDEVKS